MLLNAVRHCARRATRSGSRVGVRLWRFAFWQVARQRRAAAARVSVQVPAQFLTFAPTRRHNANVAANSMRSEPSNKYITMSPAESAARLDREHAEPILELEPLEEASPTDKMGGVPLDKFRIDPATVRAMHSKGIKELFPVQAQARSFVEPRTASAAGRGAPLSCAPECVGCRASIRSTRART
jgi:hypothetical protein